MEVFDVHTFETRAKQRLQKFLSQRKSPKGPENTVNQCSDV